MAGDKRYSIEEAAKELRTGVSTLLLWQHLYNEFLSTPGEDTENTLSREDIHLFTYISECTESGLTREEIRQALRNRTQRSGPLFTEQAFHKELDQEIQSLLEEESPTPALLARLVIQQGRIADAQERKAAAIEKSLSLKEEQNRTLSRIAQLLETGTFALPQDDPTDPPEKNPKVSSEPPPPSSSTEEPDDLWKLVEQPKKEEKLDDLSRLVDESPSKTESAPDEEEMDNLWDLVDEKPEPSKAKTPMNDTGLDDLWDLTHEAPSDQESLSSSSEEEMDNLWELVETETPTPPTDPAAYKDQILKEIIALKKQQGLSASEVAARLNQEEKPTFSGKGSWEPRTIEGIFKIIEKAGPR
ncbi:MAG: helix-turn-helix domain-containing protein [Desulfobacterales bacterium]|nr:helix-turn-helix domain-containing protein [Desulfobacterales bacterium]